MKYDALILTNLPNYYKINLFNEINKRRNIHVIFLSGSEKSRNADFTKDHIINFDYTILSSSFHTRSTLRNCVKIAGLIFKNKYKSVILGEWVSIEYWFIWLLFRKSKKSLILESNIHSISKIGVKEQVKKIFLKGISQVFASGQKQKELASFLKFKGELVQTHGVGIINYSVVPVNKPTDAFLYVGRLSQEKNLRLLVEVFNDLSHPLTIVGEGSEEETLKQLAGSNITFTGYINNRDLSEYYSTHRALLLPSREEPYGLVAEEAIYFGIPVVLSSVCGIVNTLCFDHKNALVINGNSKEAIKEAVLDMMNDQIHSNLECNCGAQIIRDKDLAQVETYAQTIRE